MAGTYLEQIENVIGLEMLRYVVRSELARRKMSTAALARELEIAPGPLRAFLAGAWPRRALWDKLTTYTRTVDALPMAAAGQVGFALVCAGMPHGLRRKVRFFLARELREYLRHEGYRAPAWVDEDLDFFA